MQRRDDLNDFARGFKRLPNGLIQISKAGGRLIELQCLEELELCEQRVLASAERTANTVRAMNGNGMDMLRRMKFEECGCDPLEDRCLNLVEQINQTFTYLASFRAVRILFQLHPGLSFRMNLGTEAGSDIEDVDRRVVAAEVFAAVKPQNNQKLRKDIQKVSKIGVPYRYVFFAAPKYIAGRQQSLDREGVEVWAVQV